MRSIGLVSLGSGDGIDAALLDTDGADEIKSLCGISLAYDSQLRWRIQEATQNDLPTTELLRVGRELTDAHVRAVQALRSAYPEMAEKAQVIGFSGHLLRHLPSEGLIAELGDPWRISVETGLPVVSDFRRHDMAIGGEGAPLSAMFHWALMAREPRPALMLNLDTIASVVWLSKQNQIVAGDTGPGVELLNEWVQEMAGHEHDLDGTISGAGQVDMNLVESALKSPFFHRALPKGAGRHQFDHIDVSGLSVEDGAATLCAITAGAIERAVARLPDIPTLLWITGIGSRQPVIVRHLQTMFAEVRNVAERGLDPNTLEAECYAWLAVRHLKRLPITTPETTGCRQAQCAGFVTGAPNETRTTLE
jgi:anhydro-N-acetylmuramic acid kinase